MAMIRFLLALGLWAGPAVAATAADQLASDSKPTSAVTGQIAVVSDYVYRGVTYNDGNPALQATVSWSNANASVLPGLHVDGLASNVDFGPGDPAHTQFYGTLGYSVGSETLNADAGVTYTLYPGVPAALGYSYVEGYVSLGTKVGRASVSATLAASPDYSGHAGAAWFGNMDAAMPLTERFRLIAEAGYAGLPRAAGEQYAFWGAGVETDVYGLTLGLRYAGNSLGGCCQARVIASIAKSF
ncbi:MAG: TorF family putative porin [Candidatus Binataceae bacterium]